MTTKQSNIDGQVTYIVLAKEKLAFTSKDHETGPDHLLVVSSMSANEAMHMLNSIGYLYNMHNAFDGIVEGEKVNPW